MSDVRGKTVRMDEDLDEDLWDAIAAERRRTGVAEAEMIRRAVVLYLAFVAAQRGGEGASLGAILESLGRER